MLLIAASGGESGSPWCIIRRQLVNSSLAAYDEALEVFRAKFKDITITNENRFYEFSEILGNFVKFAQDFVRLPVRKQKRENRRKKPINVRNPKELQKNYRWNKRQTMRAIQGDESDSCEMVLMG